MPELFNFYNQLYQESLIKIKSNAYRLDPLIDDPKDTRNGMTLLARPNATVKEKIQELSDALKAIDPQQYYYPDSDVHLTVLTIISCYPTFQLSNVNLTDYIKLIQQSLEGARSFKIAFKGITASPSALMIQGFPTGDILENIRESLRLRFKESSLEHSIDKRYKIQTAHSTVVRFRKPIRKLPHFIHTMDHYRAFDFGTFDINQLELVHNDWYQRKERVQVLHQFDLPTT